MCCAAVNMMTLMLSVLDEVVDGMSISLAGVSGSRRQKGARLLASRGHAVWNLWECGKCSGG